MNEANAVSTFLLRRPEEYGEFFKSVRNLNDIANLLEVPREHLVWHLYRFPAHRRYREFTIKKSDGSERKILAPVSRIKILQRKLADILSVVYRPPRCVHGFVPSRGIRGNAEIHRNKQWVLNIDLENFFPSINFGRVRGMLMAKPYQVPEKAATILAQLVCHQGQLPQGSPASPIVSNMVCGRLDAHLMSLARSHQCDYSRYADDISFSTNRKNFPHSIASNEVFEDKIFCNLGEGLQSVLINNGFKEKPSKSRLFGYWRRQSVTGITVNEKLTTDKKFARSLRGALNAWTKHGEIGAARYWGERFDKKDREHVDEIHAFRSSIAGRLSYLEYIRGKGDPVASSLREKFNGLIGAPTLLDAMFVIETNSSQGTGFYLDGIGIVTCAHVVNTNDEIRISLGRPGSSATTALIRWADPDADVAVLLAKHDARRTLNAARSQVEMRQTIRVLGYPSADPRHSQFESTGRVIQLKTHMGNTIALVDADIIAGVSGGPVLDLDGNVVGMARSGEPRSGADGLQEKGVVLVHTITALHNAKSKSFLR
ncbi:MAG: trypsin-like peptidase domain-containing protein [Gemmatimonas sp.]